MFLFRLINVSLIRTYIIIKDSSVHFAELFYFFNCQPVSAWFFTRTSDVRRAVSGFGHHCLQPLSHYIWWRPCFTKLVPFRHRLFLSDERINVGCKYVWVAGIVYSSNPLRLSLSRFKFRKRGCIISTVQILEEVTLAADGVSKEKLNNAAPCEPFQRTPPSHGWWL